MKYLISAFAIATISLPAYGANLVQAKKHDSSQPIEITSDALEVQQETKLAIFTGSVVAIQGDMRLKSDVMTVIYASEEGAAKTEETNSKIKRINVDGNVLFTTPDETGSGRHGIYNVEDKTITLTEDVVLTRGQNILKGAKLVYNMDTGKSVVTSDKGGTVNNARVRALVIPEQKR